MLPRHAPGDNLAKKINKKNIWIANRLCCCRCPGRGWCFDTSQKERQVREAQNEYDEGGGGKREQGGRQQGKKEKRKRVIVYVCADAGVVEQGRKSGKMHVFRLEMLHSQRGRNKEMNVCMRRGAEEKEKKKKKSKKQDCEHMWDKIKGHRDKEGGSRKKQT